MNFEKQFEEKKQEKLKFENLKDHYRLNKKRYKF